MPPTAGFSLQGHLRGKSLTQGERKEVMEFLTVEERKAKREATRRRGHVDLEPPWSPWL